MLEFLDFVGSKVMQIPAPDSILLVEIFFAPSVKQVMVAPSPV